MVSIGTSVFFAALTIVTTLFLKRPKISEDGIEDLKGIEINTHHGCGGQIVHHIQLALMKNYRDPEISDETLFILASLLGGVTDVEFSLVGSGLIIGRKLHSTLKQCLAKKSLPECHLSMQKLWR
jgi:hypothetical protein